MSWIPLRVLRHASAAACALTLVTSAAFAQESPQAPVDSVSTSDPFILDSLQIAQRRQDPPVWHSMFTNIPGDWVRCGRYTFQTKNIPLGIGITALTCALIVADAETWSLSDQWYRKSDAVRRTSDFFEYLGDGRPQFGLAAGFALWGFVASDNRALTTGSQTVEAILSCGIVIQVLKHITGRESPFLSTRPRGRWDVFPNQIEYHKHVPRFDAYPSGHIATAMATVTVVAENYPEWTWVRPVGYVISGLIGVSMANTGIHWYSDYPLGIMLGYSFGRLVAHPAAFARPAPEEASAGLSVSFSPMIDERGTGVQFVVAF